MTKLYIIRHGESLGNSKSLFLGHTDLGLTEKGHLQAELTGEFLKDKNIDVFYSSDLKRAYETCCHIADKKNKTVNIHKGLREIYAGKWEGVEFNILNEKFPSFKVWLEDMSKVRCDDGESVEELKERVVNTFCEIANKNHGKTVCITTHATPIRIMSTVFRKLPLDKIMEFPWVPNSSVTEVEYSKGEWNLIREGFKDHLGKNSTELPSNV